MRSRPRILLVGAGRFGKNHLRVLHNLERKGQVELVGVVVRSKQSAKLLKQETGLPVFTSLTSTLLKEADAVVIATPSPTHAELVARALRYAHVFVEKPLAESGTKARALARLAKKYGRILMVGHIYHYHPLIQELLTLVRTKKSRLSHISCTLLTPRAQWRGESAPPEKLHWFDFLDMVFGKKPDTLWATGNISHCSVSLRYGKTDAGVSLGWPPTQREKERRITLLFGNEVVRADFVKNTLTYETRKGEKVRHFSIKPEPLERELNAFIHLVRGGKAPYSNADVGARVVETAEQVEKMLLKKRRPRIAVIGGGLFGTTAALELAKLGAVTLFERQGALLGGATVGNQYRHHVGYHYPRSSQTIQEIKDATQDFESVYKSAIIRYPAYYAVAKKGSLISPETFLAVCKKMGLPYARTNLTPEILNPKEVALTIKTPEAVLDYNALKKKITKSLRGRNVSVRLNTSVIGARLTKNGAKVLCIKGAGEQTFDYVVSATYHHYNQFCDWLNFPKKDLELRLKELPLVRLPLKHPIAVTVMDGPFATFVPTGNTGLYTFGDVPLSVHATAKGKDAIRLLEKKMRTVQSRWSAMQKRCQKWFPFIKNAAYVKSVFVILPVERTAKNTDARPTEVTEHGFGCFSILSGKLITSVTAGRQIVDRIK